MACVCNDANGRRRIQFVGADGKRKTVRLGKVSAKQADAFKVRLEQLVAAKLTCHAPADETSRWLAVLDNTMCARLAAVGLIKPRVSMALEKWLDGYLDERAGDLKPSSLRRLRDTRNRLLACFKPTMPLRELTEQDAADWRAQLVADGLSEASIKTLSGNAKTMLQEAVRRKLIPENPFRHLKSGPTPSQYERYVTPDEIERIIEACPNAEWRLLFGLTRFAGLRLPSETHQLTWADVDWQRGRLHVRSPKTERYRGKESRTVPIVPRLMQLLQDRFDECREGEQRLVCIRGQGAIMRHVRAIWARAGVEPWERLWQVLRQSCEQEMAMTFPQYAVSKWLGHSITVSGRHYTNTVPNELYNKAAQNAAQQAAETPGIERNCETPIYAGNAANSMPCRTLQNNASFGQLEAAGIEPASRSTSRKASTCVVDRLISTPEPPVDRLRRNPTRLFSHRLMAE